jgi:rhomboid family GlyGly-CTERM serine protease
MERGRPRPRKDCGEVAAAPIHVARSGSQVFPLPWLVLLAAFAALLVQMLPAWRQPLLYDRAAIAQGQVWRMWTGHFVHFGWPHFVIDTGLLVILGWLMEARHPWFTRLGLCLMPVFISAALYLGEPDLARYGGLSAVNLGLLLYAAVQGWRRDWTDWFWPAVLAAYVGELLFEYFRGGHGGGAIRFDDPSIRVATGAHLASAAYALLALGVTRLCTTYNSQRTTSNIQPDQ